MADVSGHQSMRTRSQGLSTVTQPGSGQIRDASGGTVSNHNEERSSLQVAAERSADLQSAAKSETGFLLDMDEPVLTVTDRRIRKLVAETNMEIITRRTTGAQGCNFLKSF